jgi:2-polyprenyl-3-methyl-5-hydroxy-6-metoxy-1,4-benzoquinol methylase
VSLDNQYREKVKDYFEIARTDLMQLVPAVHNQSILEIGASGGYTLLALKQTGKASYVAGVELFQLANTEQENTQLDEFYIADVEQLNLNLVNKQFDVLILGDVLEHLRNPWQVYEYLLQFVKPGGTVIVSVPNIRFFKVMFQVIFQGDFKYTESGIMDRTHLRFFCKKNILALVSLSNTKVQSYFPSFRLQNQWKLFWANRVTLGLFEQFFTIQHIVSLKKLAN